MTEQQLAAMKLALEAIEACLSAGTEAEDQDASDKLCDARAAIREALEQPAQKRPQNCGTGYCSCIECVMEQPSQQQEPDYKALWQQMCERCDELDAKLAQQQEPVARSKAYDMIDRFLQNNLNSDEDYAEYSKALDSIYTSPQPSKPWVGLTDWEREKLRSEADEADAGYTQLIKATEAKLREKNAQPSKPLTDEQIMEMYNEPRSDAEMIAFARAIEAAHGIGEQK